MIYGGRVLTEAERKYATLNKELLAIYYAVKRNEIYLLGRKTVVFTDHKPLLSLHKFRDVINKRFRWISYLEDVGVILKYVKGVQNCVANYISRNPSLQKNVLNVSKFASVEFIENIASSGEIIELQRRDEVINKVINCVEKDELGETPKEFAAHKQKLVLVNKTLYKHHKKNLVVAPEILKKQILNISHNHFSGGHFGIFKSHRRVLETFWWPQLLEDVKQHIANCEICIKVKSLGKKRATVGVRGWSEKPMDLVSIDYLTDLPVTSRHNKHISYQRSF